MFWNPEIILASPFCPWIAVLLFHGCNNAHNRRNSLENTYLFHCYIPLVGDTHVMTSYIIYLVPILLLPLKCHKQNKKIYIKMLYQNG